MITTQGIDDTRSALGDTGQRGPKSSATPGIPGSAKWWSPTASWAAGDRLKVLHPLAVDLPPAASPWLAFGAP
jgi:hypothetical protein